MNHLRYIERTYNVPLLISASKARILEEIVRAHIEHRPLAPLTSAAAPRRELATTGTVRTDAGYFRTADGVAIVPAMGTLVQRAGDEELDAMSGITAYSTLRRQVQAAETDARVDAILIEVDSYGGEVPGIVDLVGAIRAAGQNKPVWAIANEQAFSAGMWVASAASKVFAPKTGNVGSVGVRMLHVDQSQRDAKQGIVYTTIMAGERKNDFDPHSPLSAEAQDIAQEECDRIYALFAADVAEFRGLSEDEVRGTQAGIFSAQAAKKMGLIDGIQSFDETLAQLTAEAKYVRKHGMRLAANAPIPTPETAANEGVITMATPDNTAATAAQISEAEARGRAAAVADNAKAVADAQAQGVKDAKDAAAAATARISSIMTHAEAAGRRTLAEHLAYKTTTPLDDAVAMLAASPKEAPAAPTNLLAAAMAGIPNPAVGADAGANPDGTETEAAAIARMAAYANGSKKLKAVK